jgi:uncharacterized protein YggU (UPF0235/DUF167 family)
VRIEIRVRPRSARTRVGGAYGAALVVAVTAPASGGRATDAALTAVAAAFGVRRQAVRLITGATSRTKVVDMDGDEAVLAARWSDLHGGGSAGGGRVDDREGTEPPNG